MSSRHSGHGQSHLEAPFRHRPSIHTYIYLRGCKCIYYICTCINEEKSITERERDRWGATRHRESRRGNSRFHQEENGRRKKIKGERGMKGALTWTRTEMESLCLFLFIFLLHPSLLSYTQSLKGLSSSSSSSSYFLGLLLFGNRPRADRSPSVPETLVATPRLGGPYTNNIYVGITKNVPRSSRPPFALSFSFIIQIYFFFFLSCFSLAGGRAIEKVVDWDNTQLFFLISSTWGI